MEPKICYIITSAPRSGSTLLSTLMAATGLAGNPQEHFNPWAMGMAQDFPDQLIFNPDYIREQIEATTTPNGVFGTKAHFLQITNFVGLQRLPRLFPTPLKFLYIKREDDLRQAISLAKAIQTNRYLWDQPMERRPVYNYYQIVQCLREIRVQQKGWETYFSESRIEPFRITYESFIQDTSRGILEIFQYLGIELPGNYLPPQPALRKLADSETEDWAARFLAE